MAFTSQAVFYYAALALELLATAGYLAYLVRQEKRTSAWARGLLLAGLVCHSLYLGIGWYVSGAAPVRDLKSALSFFSWCVLFSYLLFEQRFRLRVLGAFVAPFGAFLMLVSSAMPWLLVPVKPLYKSLWLVFHVGTVFMGDGLLAVAFGAAIMYLIQERAIKKKRLGPLHSRLPSLASLDTIHYQALVYGFPFLTLGMLSGSLYAQSAFGRFWQWDPKEVFSLITWLSYAVLLHERLAAGWRGRRSAILSIVCFAILIFSFLGVSFFMGGYHSFESLEAPQGS